MKIMLSLIVFLAFTGYSNAAYCVCKDGVGEQALQRAIDYACGAGADCSQIQTNGPCYQPNTVKAHCDFAVNSYFQKKSGAQGTCDFAGTATLTTSPPSASGSCYSSSSGGGTGTGTTAPTPITGGGSGMGIPTSTPTPSTGTGITPGTSITTPSTGTGTGTGSITPSTGTGITTPTTGGGTTGNPSIFGPGSMGLGPTGSGIGFDSTGTGGVATHSAALVGSLAISFWISHLVLMWA